MNKIKYEEDYYLWTKTMVEQLKNRNSSNVDWDNLIEEIELTVDLVIDEDLFPS